MRIAVCIKQVPVVSALQLDPSSKTLKRDGVPSEVSSFDVRALIKAVELKSTHGGEVIVLTMGPPQARQALVECLALGADRAIHLCDPAFAGADTLATARALALALSREDVDLIFCGRNSVDAETGQVGPEVAEFLGIPQITAAHTLSVDIGGRCVTAERETDEGFETLRAPLPAVVTAAEDLAAERFPSKGERDAAKSKACVEVRAIDLSPDLAQFGAVGSPTEVAGLEILETHRKQQLLAGSPAEAATTLARVLVDEHGLFGRWNVPSPPALGTVSDSAGGPKNVWVLAEIRERKVRPVTLELLNKASDLARATHGRVTAVLLGHEVSPHVDTLAAYGADHILLGDDERLTPVHTEVHAAVLVDAVRRLRPSIVLIPGTSTGRDLAPRVAARLQIGLTGDCIDLGLDAGGRLLQYKPAFGGSVVAPIVSRTQPEMATVRPGMLTATMLHRPHPPEVERLELTEIPDPRASIIDARRAAAEAADLEQAEIAIGVGKGIGQREHIEQLRALIDLLGAALCTTRDVTDAGWLPKQYQIGITGRAIAPKLYIAVGIRGAFEHMVGVRRAGLIVAINKNPKAPIFKAADYGIAADYAEVVPALHQHLLALQPAR